MSSTGTVILPLFIPFAGCPHRCVYCQQGSLSGERVRSPAEYGQAIGMMLGKRTSRAGEKIEAAFYGGSFTSLPIDEQAALLDQAAPFLRAGEITGIRLSTRPDAVDEETLHFLRERGVTTVELGAQSMDDGVLRRSGRGHTSADTRQAAKLVKEKDFVLGLQMMTGLPGDTPASALRTALALADLAPDMVRIYPTVVLEDTPLAKMWRRGEYEPWDLEKTLEVLSVIIPLFRSREIRIIRTGLHLDEGLLKSGRILAGPAHPSLGEEARGAVVRRRLGSLLRSTGGKTAELKVNPAEYSTYIGQGRGTIEYLREAASNPGLKVIPDEKVPRGWWRTTSER